MSEASKTLLYLAVNASYSHTSLAGGYLGSVAAASGWRWLTLETLDGADLHDLLVRIENVRPRVLATTFYLFNRECLMRIIRRYKALHPDCLVIAGGPEFDGDNRAFLAAEPAINLVIRGEGELAFDDWLKWYDHPERWPEIAGSCHCDAAGRYHDAGWADVPPDLNQLPSPYDWMTDFTRKPFIQLETSRGCTNRCSFCRGGGPGALRLSGMARIRRQLEDLRQAGIKEIRILDRTFNEPAARARRMLSMLIEDFTDLRFHLEIDPGRLTTAFVETLAQAPACQLHLEAGIQTLHPEAWRGMQRGSSPERTLNGLRMLTAMPNLTVHADLIAGLPETTLASLRDDLQTLIAAGPAELQLEILKILPGTVLHKEAAALGVVFAPEAPYEVLRTPHMSPADLASAKILSKAIDWFYNPSPLRAIVRSATPRIENLWDRLSEVVIRHSSGAVGKPGLRNRFLWLASVLEGHQDLIHKTQFAWMLQGLGERSGFIVPHPWRRPVPADAELLIASTGTANAAPRRWLVKLDQDYLFEHHTGADGERSVAIYRLADQGNSKVKPKTAAP